MSIHSTAVAILVQALSSVKSVMVFVFVALAACVADALVADPGSRRGSVADPGMRRTVREGTEASAR